MYHYPDHLLKIISTFKKLPGVGSKTAERFAFHLIGWPKEKLEEMGKVIEEMPLHLKQCLTCGALLREKKCSFCDSQQRNKELLCIVSSPKDVFLIEETREFEGLYHVLGGLLSPFHGKTVETEVLEKLKKRVEENRTKEVVIALDSTLEGDATSLFIKKELERFSVIVSRLALGLPMGSSLDFIDGGTLAKALAGRRSY